MGASNRTLYLDGNRVLLRGVTYSPTPIGLDQSAADPKRRIVDFFAPENAAIWRRDLPLMRQMGMNAVRLYDLSVPGDHAPFLDLAHSLNITVIAGFPLHNDVMDLRDTSGESPTLNPYDLSLAVRRARGSAHARLRARVSGCEAATFAQRLLTAQCPRC